jgi:chloramphenicol-sensitive protein RarD
MLTVRLYQTFCLAARFGDVSLGYNRQIRRQLRTDREEEIEPLQPMRQKGILYAIGAYTLWGILPVYWKALQRVPPVQILGHRVVWSFALLAVLIALRGEATSLIKALASRRAALFGVLAAGLLGVNWLVYIWAVNSSHVVESSLGYFINPLVSVLMGVLFLKERLRPTQWFVVGLAACGVVYLSIRAGAPPWISLALALTFAFYGLLKKTSPLEALPGLGLELALLFLPALAYLLLVQGQGVGAFGHAGVETDLLLAFAGVVTTLPILMFGLAARNIPLTLVGLLQYIAPTCQFLLGVLDFGEPFSQDRLLGFSLIWLALLIYWLEGWLTRRKATPPRNAQPEAGPLKTIR